LSVHTENLRGGNLLGPRRMIDHQKLEA
jgi:hypothetical protein